jgi:hypothetical protein
MRNISKRRFEPKRHVAAATELKPVAMRERGGGGGGGGGGGDAALAAG